MAARPPVAALNTGHPVSALEGCPITAYENWVLAGGTGHLTLLQVDTTTDAENIDVKVDLYIPHVICQAGRVVNLPLDAIAWGSAASGLHAAAVGGGTVVVHRFSDKVKNPSSEELFKLALPTNSLFAPTRSCCFLGGSIERLAVVGDDCRCHLLQLDKTRGAAATADSAPPAAVERTYSLSSPGVAVRTHSREPSQLMIAEEDGKVHFVDLRMPGTRPSLSRDLPAGETDPGGLRDADWSSCDPYHVGGVCGKRWFVWDLRQAGVAPKPYVGETQLSGALCFRWHPYAASFATAGATVEPLRAHVQLNDLQPVDAAPATGAAAGWAAGAASPPRLFAHDLPTRVATISWLYTQPPLLLGAADTKVCLWSPRPDGPSSAIM